MSQNRKKSIVAATMSSPETAHTVANIEGTAEELESILQKVVEQLEKNFNKMYSKNPLTKEEQEAIRFQAREQLHMQLDVTGTNPSGKPVVNMSKEQLERTVEGITQVAQNKILVNREIKESARKAPAPEKAPAEEVVRSTTPTFKRGG